MDHYIVDPKTHPGALFQGSNFMTPDVIAFGWIASPRIADHPIAYEFSTGRGFDPDTVLFGVTIRSHPQDRRLERRLSRVFVDDRAGAEAYIMELKRRNLRLARYVRPAA